MKVKNGACVMYNGEVFTVNTVERDNGRAFAVWCRDINNEEFYLTFNVLEDVLVEDEIFNQEKCDETSHEV